MWNCIVWGNTPNGMTGNPSVAWSDVQGGYSGTGNIDADPLFVDADGADNVAGTEDDNLRLQLTSPAIDAGINSAVPAGITADHDGRPRFFDIGAVPDTGNGAAPIVDMGAYEAQIRVYLPLVVRQPP